MNQNDAGGSQQRWANSQPFRYNKLFGNNRLCPIAIYQAGKSDFPTLFDKVGHSKMAVH